MSLPSAPFHPRVLRMKTGVALVMAALAGAALAAAQAHAQTPATAAPRVRANVPAGPLGAALAGFARQAQVLLSFDPALADGLQSPGLQGSHGVQEGFDALLAGTSLQAHRRADGDFELRRAGAEAAQLAPVVVLGAGATTEGSGLYTADWMRSANGLVLSQRDTPQSTSVITRQQMDDRAIGSVRDVMENATGMNVQQAESERLTYYSRGFSMDTFQFDGVVKPLNSLYQFGEGNLDPAIYDHVEIIRGATGLMSGTGNPGGSVNFIRKRPTREFQERPRSLPAATTRIGARSTCRRRSTPPALCGAPGRRERAPWRHDGSLQQEAGRAVWHRRGRYRRVDDDQRGRFGAALASARHQLGRPAGAGRLGQADRLAQGPGHGREVVALGHGFP